MPELPEVEIVKQSLNKMVKEKRVQKVIIRNRNLRVKLPINFKKYFEKQKIIKIERFSKYLILNMSNDIKCLIHLGMSGTIHLVKKDTNNTMTNLSFYSEPKLPNKHNHIEIFFKKFKIVYNDPRRFGFFEIIKNDEQLKKRLKHLGPEPFSSNFNTEYIFLYFKNKKKNIKNFLLDQGFVSGIGNIYASEILFLCEINPFIKACNLNKKECKKILINSQKVLLSAIEKGGSSIRDFKNLSGKKGEFQKNFNVYDRQGMRCKRKNCVGHILKKNISNRSTFFCNTCQK